MKKKGFTFNLLQSCWGFAAPQIEAITDQQPASGWHISWRRAAGSDQQTRGVGQHKVWDATVVEHEITKKKWDVDQRFSHSQRFIGLSEGHWNGDSLESGCHYKKLKPKKSMDVSHPLKRKNRLKPLGSSASNSTHPSGSEPELFGTLPNLQHLQSRFGLEFR